MLGEFFQSMYNPFEANFFRGICFIFCRFDETFIHNFYGYLSSAIMQGHAPNLFQMLAFLDSADVVLVDFPLWTGRLANVVLGRWIGRGFAGYKVEYKEFSEDSE